MWTVLLALAALALAATCAAQERKITSFETDAERRLEVANHSVLQPVDRPVTEGKTALRVEFRPADWPNITFRPAEPWDWRGWGGLAIDIHNPGKDPVAFGVRVDDDTRADGARFCRQGGATIAPGATETFVLPIGENPMDHGMRGVPTQPGKLTGIGVQTAGPLRQEHIVAFQVFLSSPAQPLALVLDNIRLIPWSLPLDGIVDRWGQYTRADWPGKLKSDADLRQRREREEADLRARPALRGRDRFGGWEAGPRRQATGWFRTERVDGKWWLVDPDGRLFFSMGVDCLTTNNQTFVTGRERMFTWLPGPDDPLRRHMGHVSGVHSGPRNEGDAFDFYSANLERKYGADYKAAWREVSLRRLPSWGFNTIANWSDWTFHRNGRVPYVATAGIGGDHARVASGQDYWGKMHDPFDPRFAANAERAVASVAASVGHDPWCIGWFVDNELSWGGGDADESRFGLVLGALAMPAAESPAKRALVAELKRRHGDVARFNASWGAQLSRWEDLDAPFRPSGPASDARRADLIALSRHFARQYFRVVRDAVKRVAPNHLYLGCRFAWATREAVDAAAEYCDVVSFNIYAPRVDDARYGYLREIGKPCIIGEFHFGALDRGMFHTGLVAATSQRERAAMYREYLHSVLDHPAFVGCHWFQYVDQPLTGRWFDGENYNIGFVTITDTPYPEMVEAARAVHATAYNRRYRGAPNARPSGAVR